MFQSVIVKRDLDATTHCTPAEQRPRSVVVPSSSSSLFSRVCFVVMYTCLLVVGRHSLVLTDLRRKGACNQGEKALKFYCGGVTRRHSFGKCVLTTLLKKYIRKKTSSSDKVSFISPIRDADRFGF